jgi:prephenate dehydrogenase
VAAADAIVLAAPVDAILALLPRLPALTGRARVITDTGSTKQAIAAAAADAGLTSFVPGHPMAGGTSSGPGQARADLFDGRPWLLFSRSASPQALAAATRFVGDLGADVITLADDGSEHDRLMAAISHLPQVVATLLAARVGDAVGQTGLRFAGGGLRDMTRLAASQASVWAPILATNAGALAPLLRALAADLEQAAAELDDRASIERRFARAHAFTFDP